MKFESWFEIWLAHKKPELRDSSYNRYKRDMDNLIVPNLGEYELDQLSKEVLEEFAKKMFKTLSANSAKNIISHVKSALKYAVEVNEIGVQYSDAMRYKVKTDNTIRKKKCLTETQQVQVEAYIKTLPPNKLIGILLCLYTGLRPGELLALQWTDVDLDNEVISVTKSCSDGYVDHKGVKVIGEPKTDSSYRLIPIAKPLIPYLRALKKSNVSGYLIEGKNGKVVSMRSFFNSLDIMLKKLNIPHIGLHGLRHSFATRANESGMDMKTLSELMGHSDVAVTMKVYAHSLSKHKFDMMNMLGKNLKAV